jgi:hypothetical protein
MLQLWSYERFTIARPRIDLSPYEQYLYHDGEEDQPTMGPSGPIDGVSTIVVAQ